MENETDGSPCVLSGSLSGRMLANRQNLCADVRFPCWRKTKKKEKSMKPTHTYNCQSCHGGAKGS